LQNQDIFTVVQPDICVICDNDKLDEQGCNGAPDWIIEIISKDTAKKDSKTKYDLYEENGVKEYWLIFPSDQAIQQFVLNEESQQYQLSNIYTDEKASSYLFPDLEIDLEQLFKN
jgi:Uma2 family endonuclease